MNIVLTLHLSLSLSIAGLLPQIADQNGYGSLGQLSIIAIYLVNLSFNLIGSGYLSKIKYRYGFLLQGLLSVPSFFASNIIARCTPEDESLYCQSIYPIVIIGCILLGAGLGGYFVLQNQYVSACSNKKNQDLHFGITYFLLGTSYLLSGIVQQQILELVGRRNFFLIAGASQFVLATLFIFVKQPTQQNKLQAIKVQDDSLLQNSETNTSNTQDQDQNGLSNKIQLISDAEYAKLGFTQQLKTIFSQINKQLSLMIPMFIMTGLIVGFEFGVFYKFVNLSIQKLSKDEQNLKITRAFQFLGAGQITSGVFNALVNKFFGTRMNTIIFSNSVFICMTIAFLSYYKQEYQFNLALGFLLGFTDNSGAFSSAISISENFGRISVFGLYLFCQNFGIVLINIVAIVASNLLQSLFPDDIVLQSIIFQ
ncbi:hypothetical protein pb186bvf_008637 [Paramecium bursaria]